MAKKESTKPNSPQANRPLRGSLKASFKLYWKQLRTILITTLLPLLIIFALRLLSDDYTGDQYSTLIGLVSVFNTLLLARLVTVGRDAKAVKLLPYYNGVMSRYLSGVGLIMMIAVYSAPLLVSLLLMGLIAVDQLAVGWLALIIPFFIIGIGTSLLASLSIFAFMDDLSVNVIQTLRISGRVVRRYFRPLIGRAIGAVVCVIVFGVAMVYFGTLIAPVLQSARVQLIADAVLSWIFTPFVFCYGAVIYRRLIEAYE